MPEYRIDSVARACELLSAFHDEEELLRLRDITARTGLHKVTAYRLLATLEQGGLVERVGRCQYRSRVRILRRQKITLGYAAQSTEFAFSRDVTESIRRAAAREQINLIVVDNRYSPKVALRNAEYLIKQGVDLVMEFQTDEQVAPILSARYAEAGIPMVAIEIPHPGATYFGANNYAAGLIGGRRLGKWAQQAWDGKVDEILLLELPMAGPLPRSRLTGILQGLYDSLPEAENCRVIRLNGNGQFGQSLEATRRHLRLSRARNTLVGTINDPSALGALRAFEEAGRADSCAVMGQNASAEARAEMRRRGTRLIGSVAYFPERYGDHLIPLVLDILHKRSVPPAAFVKHQLITPENVDRYYPNDALIDGQDLERMLFQAG